jgi:hypothetical protein
MARCGYNFISGLQKQRAYCHFERSLPLVRDFERVPDCARNDTRDGDRQTEICNRCPANPVIIFEKREERTAKQTDIKL